MLELEEEEGNDHPYCSILPSVRPYVGLHGQQSGRGRAAKREERPADAMQDVKGEYEAGVKA